MTSPSSNDALTPKQMSLSSREDKRLAKYCNVVMFARVDENIIMNFIARDDGMVISGDNGAELEQGVLIERILVDKNHARKIADKIYEVLDQKENAKK